nr:MAG: capsid protein [Cressdnaviricota sp.]
MPRPRVIRTHNLYKNKMAKRLSFAEKAAMHKRRRMTGNAMIVTQTPAYRQRGRPSSLSSHAPEVKSVDLVSATYGLNATANITAINLITAGSSFFNRIGRKIEMKSIQIRGSIGITNVGNTQADYGRVMLVYDRQFNGAYPSITDILEDTVQAGTNTTNVQSGMNLNNRDRFQVIWDNRVALPPNDASGSSVQNMQPSEFSLDVFKKLKNLVTQYKADSSPAVVGDIATGSLLFVTLGGTTAGSEAYKVVVAMRLRYVDL